MILLNHSIVNIVKTIVVSWVECTDVYTSSLIKALLDNMRDCRGRDRMVVGCTTIYPISTYHPQNCEFESHSGVMYLIQHYIIMSYYSYHT